ncbi:MAG: HAD family hydrolase [Alphaproteobacteria bacterium]|nr:HAD family hydrolase [Alphaproteobacteria bacterium]
MMNHKLLVFDWNGTILADTVPAWAASNILLEFHGAQPISLQKFRATFHFPVIHFYKLNGCDVDDVLARREESNALFQTTYERMSARCRTRRGVRELLAWLRAQGVSCIVLSNYRTDKIKTTLARLGLEDYFHHISAHDCDGSSILTATSKLERLSAFMDAQGFSPQNTVIIGDSHEEPEIARHLGVTSISITGGVLSAARLRKAQPDYLIHAMQQVRKILEARWADGRKE